MPTLFTRIISGEIPGEFIVRGSRWVALCDLNPTAPGHCLLIPVAEAAQLHELPPATLGDLGDNLARLTAAVRLVTGCPAVNVVLNDGPAAGQEVPHVHLHVIPRYPDDGLRSGLCGGTRASAESLSTMGAALRAAWSEA